MSRRGKHYGHPTYAPKPVAGRYRKPAPPRKVRNSVLGLGVAAALTVTALGGYAASERALQEANPGVAAVPAPVSSVAPSHAPSPVPSTGPAVDLGQKRMQVSTADRFTPPPPTVSERVLAVLSETFPKSLRDEAAVVAECASGSRLVGPRNREGVGLFGLDPSSQLLAGLDAAGIPTLDTAEAAQLAADPVVNATAAAALAKRDGWGSWPCAVEAGLASEPVSYSGQRLSAVTSPEQWSVPVKGTQLEKASALKDERPFAEGAKRNSGDRMQEWLRSDRRVEAGTPRAAAVGLLRDYGFGLRQWACLDRLWWHESGWDMSSTDPNDPQNDTGGIPQANPASKMASAGDDWETNPVTQIKWGLSYISTYSWWNSQSGIEYPGPKVRTPCGVWDVWRWRAQPDVDGLGTY